MSIKKTTEEFVKKAKALHGDSYDYSKVIYINSESPVIIHCNVCGDDFLQTPHNHNNKTHPRGCPRCGESKSKSCCRSTKEAFIKKAISIHGDKYDYSKVNYINALTKVEILCNKCKQYFSCTPNNHLHARGCPKCSKELNSKKLAFTENEFLERFKKIHGKKYTIDEINYKNQRSKIKVYCKQCKKYFIAIAGNLLVGHGCPYCQTSKGENEIKKWLDKNKIDYVFQYRFLDCKDKKPLPFDFFIKSYNICIEFQGIQHYEEGKRFFTISTTGLTIEEKYNLQKKHDKIKKNYCKNKGINFLEIRYDEPVEEKLENFFKNIKKLNESKNSI